MEKYYRNPKSLLKLRTNSMNPKINKSWLMINLITHTKIQKILRDYRRDKKRNLEKVTSSILNKDKKIKNQPLKRTYDTSDLGLKALIGKIDTMIKNQPYSRQNILDELNREEKKISKSNNVFLASSEYDDCIENIYEKSGRKNQHKLFNEYGIMKMYNKKNKKKNDRKKYKEIRKSSVSATRSSKSRRKTHSKNKLISQYQQGQMEIKIKKAASPCKNSKKDKMRKSKKIKTEINKFNYII